MTQGPARPHEEEAGQGACWAGRVGGLSRGTSQTLQEVGPGRRVTCRTQEGTAAAPRPCFCRDAETPSRCTAPTSPVSASTWGPGPHGGQMGRGLSCLSGPRCVKGGGQRRGRGCGVRSGLLWVPRGQRSWGCRVRRGPAHRGEGLGAEVGVREGQAPSQPGPRGWGTGGLTGQHCLFSLMDEEGN